MKMNSKITKKKPIDYKKEFIIKQLFADPKILEIHKQRLLNILPKNTSQEEINKRIHAMIVKENAFNMIMEYLSKQFEYEFDSKEIEKVSERFAIQFKIDPEKEKEKVNSISQKIIIKALIFKEIILEEKITEILLKEFKIKFEIEK